MRIIGLTGQTGSGKGAVSEILKNFGAYIIDTDKIAHDIILNGNPAYNELISYFGNDIIGENGEINRRVLGNMVFSQGGEKLEFLNNCTHKYIYIEIEKQLKYAEDKNYKIAVIDAPLLIEGNFINLCNEVWAVFADSNIRAERIMTRDSITYEQALNRMSRQKEWDVYKKFADVIINNTSDINYLKEQISKAIRAGERNDI